MYTFNVFKKAGIEPHANAVLFGISSNLLPVSSVAEFEEYMITSKGAKGSPHLLVFEGTNEEAIRALEEAGYVDDGNGRFVLRYAALASLDSEGQKLLDDIESIYADFDYPSDMEPFIYYMPNDKGDASTSEIVSRYREFLVSERARLGL